MRPIRERIWRATRVEAVGWPVFEHREACLTPLGGGTIAQSLIRTVFLVSIRGSYFHYGTVTEHRNYGKYPRLN